MDIASALLGFSALLHKKESPIAGARRTLELTQKLNENAVEHLANATYRLNLAIEEKRKEQHESSQRESKTST